MVSLECRTSSIRCSRIELAGCDHPEGGPADEQPRRPRAVPSRRDTGRCRRRRTGGDRADRERAEYAAWLGREAAAGREPELGAWLLDDVEPWDVEPWD